MARTYCAQTACMSANRTYSTTRRISFRQLPPIAYATAPRSTVAPSPAPSRTMPEENTPSRSVPFSAAKRKIPLVIPMQANGMIRFAVPGNQLRRAVLRRREKRRIQRHEQKNQQLGAEGPQRKDHRVRKQLAEPSARHFRSPTVRFRSISSSASGCTSPGYPRRYPAVGAPRWS